MGFLLIVKNFLQENWRFIVKCLRWLVLLILIVLSVLYVLDKFNSRNEVDTKPSKVINADGTINTNNHYQEATKVQTNTIERTSFVYIPKETPQDADVEFNNADKKVFVKVNGQQHEIENNVTETQKFENGKLVVTQKEESVISIAAPKPAKTSLSFYYGGGNSYGVGVNYNISKHVTLNGLYVDHKAYAGVTVPIGNMDSSSKKQDISKQEKEVK